MLTPAQIQTLKAAIAAETDGTFVSLRSAGATGAMAEWFNADSTFVVWRTELLAVELHSAYVWSEMDSLTQSKFNQLSLMLSQGRVNPSLPNVRQGFVDILAGAGLANTRAALIDIAKRNSTRAERLFATGTGTSGVPGTLTFEGAIGNDDVALALGS